MPVATRFALADPVAGAELLGAGEFFVVVPRGSITNLVTNPSFETGTTGHTASGSAIARSASYQARGVYALQITPNNSVAGEGDTFAVTLLANTQYTFSCDVRGSGGVAYYIAIERTYDGKVMARFDFYASGDWQRVYVIGQTLAAGAYRVALRTGARSNRVFYTDGWMLHAGGRRETYVDGDQRGMIPNFQDYYWNGTPHASTSVRVANSAAGGEIMSLKSIGFRLLSIVGLGLSGLASQFSPIATGGAFYQGTVVRDRTFALVGALEAASYLGLARARQELIDYFAFTRVSPAQPVKLLYAPSDDCGMPLGAALEIPCVFEDGLSGKIDNEFGERTALTFRMYLPFIQATEERGAVLSYQTVIASADYLIANIDGVWQKLGTAANGALQSVAIGLDGKIYVSGDFTSIGGVSANRVAYYDPATGVWAAMGTGFGAGTYAYKILIHPATGSPYFFGTFTTANGVTVNRATYWNGSTFVALGSPAGGSATAYDAVFDAAGNLYVATSGTWGGVAVNGAAKWNGSAWSSAGSGSTAGSSLAVRIGPDGYVYIGGTTEVNKGLGDGSAWIDINGPLLHGFSFHFGPDGSLYAVSVSQLYRWNGTQWTSFYLSTDAVVIANYAGNRIVTDQFGNLLIAGRLSATATFYDFIVPAGTQQRAYLYDYTYPATASNRGNWDSDHRNGTYVAVGDRTGTVTAAGLTTVTNGGTSKTYPVIRVTGAGTLYSIRNYTTGAALYFDLTILAGETVVLDFSDPNNVLIYSNARENLLSSILPGSNLDFFLTPGDNDISMFADATAATISWRLAHHAIDGAITR